MRKLYKITIICLALFTIALFGLSCLGEALYGSLADYYPYGLYVKAEVEEQPSTYTVLTNDTYIQQAITTQNWTWVQQDDSSSEFVNNGFPQHILWLPSGNYLIHKRFADGIPESWKFLPPPKDAAQISAGLWTGLFIVLGLRKYRIKNK